MEETLISIVPAILAVGVAVFLRLRRSIREASDEAAALQKRVAALEHRTLQLEGALWQAEASARYARFREESLASLKRQGQGATPPISPAYRPELAANSLPLTEGQKEIAEVRNQPEVMYAEVSREPTVEDKYITEFDSIVERLERSTGCDLSRWLGIPPQEGQPAASTGQMTRVSKAGLQSRDSTLFRLRIQSLQAFCSYQASHSQMPEGFVPSPPKAAGVIH